MKNEKDKKGKGKSLEESVAYIPDSPDTPYEMVNKYGTYEIQPTAETENAFPTIAQGLAKKGKKPTIRRTGNPKKNSI